MSERGPANGAGAQSERAPARVPERPRILGVAASARKRGNSAALLGRVLEALNGECSTEVVYLAGLDLHPCDGCHRCEADGRCRIDDDMRDLYTKLLTCDALLLAAPAYMGGIASRMQVFMERTWPLRKGQMTGKVGSYIVTGRRRIGMATGVMEEYFTRLGATKLPGVLGYAFNAGEIEEDSEALNRARGLAAELTNHLGRETGETWRSR